MNCGLASNSNPAENQPAKLMGVSHWHQHVCDMPNLLNTIAMYMQARHGAAQRGVASTELVHVLSLANEPRSHDGGQRCLEVRICVGK